MRIRHGMTHSPEYKAFVDAKYRCQNPNIVHYQHYGGRGIKFQFTSFQEFYAEIGPRPSKLHSLDRIENTGHYEPGNIRWATKAEQSRNTSRTILDESTVSVIRTAFANGIKKITLARVLNVPIRLVRQVVTNQTWKQPIPYEGHQC